MKTTISLLLTIFVISVGYSYGQTTVHHNLITNKKIVIKNKSSNKVLEGVNTPGTQVRQVEHNGTPSQHFRLEEAGNGNFHILNENNLFLSLKFNPQASSGESSTATGSRVLVLDKGYAQRPTCLTTAFANCPVHQLWKIKPVANESQVFTIESVASNTALQPFSNVSGGSVLTANISGADNQKWVIVETDDLLLTPIATQQEISEFEEIMATQSGVAVLSGDTTKPIYFHHNKPNEQIYKYSKTVHIPHTSIKKSINAWFPVEANRKTFCGRVKEYKQVTQDFEHDGTFNLDIDANLHIIPNPKFSSMLKNPRMESYAHGRYFKERFALHCGFQFPNCINNPLLKKAAEDKANVDVQKLLQDFNKDNIEVEFSPAMLGNPKDSPDKEFLRPINSMFSFAPINLGKNVCAYGPWMWERIILDDLPIVVRNIANAFADDYFNNEIHPANQIWFREENTLNLIALVDQTGYFENPSNPSNNTEVNASGLNQRMRFHVAFKIPATVLNGDTNSVLEHQVNAVGFKFTNIPATNVAESVFRRKYKDTLRLEIRDNSFVRIEKTHRVFLDKVKNRPDGSIQGYLVVETQPITRRGGSIDIFISNR